MCKSNKLVVPFKVFLCFVFAVLDYYICLVAKVYFKPLFLDTLFEMTAGFAFGPFYGILSVLFKRVWDIALLQNLAKWPNYLYSFCTIFAILIICPYKKHFLQNEKDKLLLILKLFFLSMIICLEMSISGGVIGKIVSLIMKTPYSMTVQTDSFMGFFSGFIHNTLLLEIISRIPVNVIDRIIAVFIPYGISILLCKAPLFRQKEEEC